MDSPDTGVRRDTGPIECRVVERTCAPAGVCLDLRAYEVDEPADCVRWFDPVTVCAEAPFMESMEETCYVLDGRTVVAPSNWPELLRLRDYVRCEPTLASRVLALPLCPEPD